MRIFLAMLVFIVAGPAAALCGPFGDRSSSLAEAKAVAVQIGEPVTTIDNAALAQATSNEIHDLAGAPRVPTAALIALSGTKGVAVVTVVAPSGCVVESIILSSAVLKQLIGEGI